MHSQSPIGQLVRSGQLPNQLELEAQSLLDPILLLLRHHASRQDQQVKEPQ